MAAQRPDTSAASAAAELVEISQLARNQIVLNQWYQVVDLLLNSEDEKHRIKRFISRAGLYDNHMEAVLQTLQVWDQEGRQVDLLEVLRKIGLNAFAGEIQEAYPEFESQYWQGSSHGGNPQSKELPIEVPTPGFNYFFNASPDSAPVAGSRRQHHPIPSTIWFDVGEVVHNFHGRTDELEELHKMLAESRKLGSTILVCISGLGGIGKSTLARKYAWTYRSSYDGNVLWINVDTPDSVRSSFMKLLERLGLTSAQNTPTEEIVRSVYDALKNRKCLFIFDNVEDKSGLKQFLPTASSPETQAPYFLVTSRLMDVTPLPKNRLNLDVLKLMEAVDMIREYFPSLSEPSAAELATKLQRLPLALQQAIAYMEHTYFGDSNEYVTKYLKEFEEAAKKLLDDERFMEDVGYTRTTFTTWTITLTRIREMEGGLAAIQVINALSFLTPDNTSVEFLRSIFESETEGSLKLLQRFSMINSVGGRMVSIHRLVQLVVRWSLGHAEEKKVLEVCVKAVESVFKKNEYSALTRECASHGLHLYPFQLNDRQEMCQACGYFSVLHVFLFEYGNASEGLSIVEQTVEVFESTVGIHDVGTLELKWRLATAHESMGNLPAALQLLESLLPIAKSALGEEHWLVLCIHASIANVYSADENTVEKAIEIYDFVIGVCTKLGKEDDVKLLRDKCSKGEALFRLGRLDDALKIFQHVHERSAILHGPDHPRTLTVRRRIGDVALWTRNPWQALRIYQEVLVKFQSVFGEAHHLPAGLQKVIVDLQNCLDNPRTIDGVTVMALQLGESGTPHLPGSAEEFKHMFGEDIQQLKERLNSNKSDNT